MYGKIAVVSYSGGSGRTMVCGHLFNAASKAGVNANLFGYDVEKQDWLSSDLLQDAIEEPIYTMVPSLDTARCNFCGNCLRFCSRFAIKFDRIKPEISLLPDRCHSCGDCMKGCSHEGISLQQQQIGNLFRSQDGQVCVGEAADGVRFILPLFLALNQELNNTKLVFCDFPPGDSGFVSTSLIGASLVILLIVPSTEWESQTRYMLEYLRSMKLNCCILINKTDKKSGFYTNVANFCSKHNVQIVGEIRLLASNTLVSHQQDPHILEIFQNILAEVGRKLSHF
ncbi:MAG: 4Fe-4S dicluster domain-containing protein [Bacteroidota bacterium]